LCSFSDFVNIHFLLFPNSKLVGLLLGVECCKAIGA
jgi:hypothetical protein